MCGGGKMKDINKELINACEFNEVFKVKQLLEAGADVNARDNLGWTALILASQNDNKEVVELLLANGADVNAKDKGGWTALMWASERGYKGIVELLLEKGADVNAKNNNGWTALMIASFYGRKEVVELLIKYGADVDGVCEILLERLISEFNNLERYIKIFQILKRRKNESRDI
jgi:ankyrin repeat protein